VTDITKIQERAASLLSSLCYYWCSKCSR